jgi:hypothetical protein
MGSNLSSRFFCVAAVLIALGPHASTQPQAAQTSYPQMAPVAQYRMDSREAEIALARSAAPPSISGDAEILVLGAHGYESVVRGKNGFVCLVERSWDASFDDPEFWNPKLRGPDCFNPPAARTQLPQYLKRTEWVLDGATRQQLIDRTKAAIAGHTFQPPEAGSLSFMLSKNGYLSDSVKGPWVPHVMFFFPYGHAGDWAAGSNGSPVIGKDSSPIETTILMVPVPRWSDGSAAVPLAATHSM